MIILRSVIIKLETQSLDGSLVYNREVLMDLVYIQFAQRVK